jgi:molybdenum cofactor cytidylyltransferase
LPPLSSIAPVILAAGDSVRMGYPKALLPLESDCFLTRILKTVRKAGLGRPTVVLGRSAPLIQSRVDLETVAVIVNPDPDRGQLSSMQAAFSSLESDCAAALIWPVDQPLVSVDLIQKLSELFFSSGSLITTPMCRKRRGHPVIFRRELFCEFMQAPLDEGPKKIVIGHQDSTAVLSTDETGTILDIDTPSDYENVFGRSLDSVLAPLLSE